MLLGQYGYHACSISYMSTSNLESYGVRRPSEYPVAFLRTYYKCVKSCYPLNFGLGSQS